MKLSEFVTDDVDENTFFEYISYIEYENYKFISDVIRIYNEPNEKAEKMTNEMITSLSSIKCANLENNKKKKKIGEGSFGVVYQIKEKDSTNICACEISKIEMIDSSELEMNNLIRGVTILSKLNHLSAMKFIGYSPFNFKKCPKPVIMTELLANSSLETVIELERMSFSIEGRMIQKND